jgi:acetyl-CoA synthetase
VIFGGFAPSAVRERLEVSAARALITADGARRKGKTFPVKATVDDAVDDLATVETIVVVRSAGSPCPMRPGRDVWYEDLLGGADGDCPAEPMEAEHPLFLLYSSGSTAKPKGIVHTTGGYLTGVASTTATVFDLDPERDVFWCTADVGWITGHSYVVYGPMANGCTWPPSWPASPSAGPGTWARPPSNPRSRWRACSRRRHIASTSAVTTPARWPGSPGPES